jgi:thioredoxin-dependent peroxiredoxin
MKNIFPKFALKDQNRKVWQNQDLKDRWSLFFVYPKDDTPGCTTENQDFSVLIPKFSKLNCLLFGVSPDSTDRHASFCKKRELKHTLLSDPEKELLIPLGVWGEKKNYGKTYKGVIRSTFLVSPSGEIAQAWMNVKAKGHADRILKEVESIVLSKEK